MKLVVYDLEVSIWNTATSRSRTSIVFSCDIPDSSRVSVGNGVSLWKVRLREMTVSENVVFALSGGDGCALAHSAAATET